MYVIFRATNKAIQRHAVVIIDKSKWNFKKCPSNPQECRKENRERENRQ